MQIGRGGGGKARRKGKVFFGATAKGGMCRIEAEERCGRRGKGVALVMDYGAAAAAAALATLAPPSGRRGGGRSKTGRGNVI